MKLNVQKVEQQRDKMYTQQKANSEQNKNEILGPFFQNGQNHFIDINISKQIVQLKKIF